MFLEGASFDHDDYSIVESKPKVLYVDNFRLRLEPYDSQRKSSQEEVNSNQQEYDCPLYRTADRRGELLTTGHSTNFVTYMQLPTDVDPDRWIKRGVALLLELNF